MIVNQLQIPALLHAENRKNGMKSGMYRAYYKNGELYFKGRFKDDKRTGKWKKYNPEGKKILQVQYD